MRLLQHKIFLRGVQKNRGRQSKSVSVARKKLIGVAIFLFSIIFLAGCGDVEPVEKNSSEAPIKNFFTEINIGVALYSSQNEYMKRFAAAAQTQAALEHVNLIFCDGNYNASIQVSQVRELLEENVDGIILVAHNAEGSADCVKLAESRGTPILTVNTKVVGEKNFVGSDDTEAGELMMLQVAQAIGGRGKVVLLEGPLGQSAQIERLLGIQTVLKNFPQIKIIGCKSANWSRTQARSIMQRWLMTFDEINAVAAENDDMALGALDVLEHEGLKIPVVGIDGSAEALKKIRDGSLYATVFQDAQAQGILAVKILVGLVRGENFPSDYKIPLEVVTSSNAEKFLTQ